MTNNKEIRQNNTDMLSPNNQSNTVNSQTNAKHTQDENIKNDIKESNPSSNSSHKSHDSIEQKNKESQKQQQSQQQPKQESKQQQLKQESQQPKQESKQQQLEHESQQPKQESKQQQLKQESQQPKQESKQQQLEHESQQPKQESKQQQLKQESQQPKQESKQQQLEHESQHPKQESKQQQLVHESQQQLQQQASIYTTITSSNDEPNKQKVASSNDSSNQPNSIKNDDEDDDASTDSRDGDDYKSKYREMKMKVKKLKEENEKLREERDSYKKKYEEEVSKNTKQQDFAGKAKSGSYSQSKPHARPAKQTKESIRIAIFNENKKIANDGLYTYYDKYLYKNLSFNIKKDLEYSVTKTELIPATEKLALDPTFTSNKKKKTWGHKEKAMIYDKIEIWPESTFYEAMKMKRESKKVCVLNFASATQPGGGIKNGRNSQEECLCRQSTLYFALERQEKFYKRNCKHYDSYGPDEMIYSPNVLIIRDDNDQLIAPVKVSVISAVAVNKAELFDSDDYDEDEIYKAMRKRCLRILELCLCKGNDVIVLGAFGCGVFQNSPEEVSGIFKELLVDEFYGMPFKKIVFAIKCKPNESNELFDTFKSTFTPKRHH